MILHPKSTWKLFRYFVIFFFSYHLSSSIRLENCKFTKRISSRILDLKRTTEIIQSNLPKKKKKKSEEDEWCSIGTLESLYKAEVSLSHFHLRPLSKRVFLQRLQVKSSIKKKKWPMSGILSRELCFWNIGLVFKSFLPWSWPQWTDKCWCCSLFVT